jgi:hypothetical protein
LRGGEIYELHLLDKIHLAPHHEFGDLSYPGLSSIFIPDYSCQEISGDETQVPDKSR